MNLDGTIEVVRKNLKKPLVTATIGLIIGLLVGLPLLGWWVFPVKWIDAAPQHLREDVKAVYMGMMIESYAYNQDSFLALNRWKELGDGATMVLQQAQADSNLDSSAVTAFSQLVGVPYSPVNIAENPEIQEIPLDQEITENAEVAPATQAASSNNEVVVIVATSEAAEPVSSEVETRQEQTGKLNPLMLLGVLLLMLLLVGGALLYVLVLRKKPGAFLAVGKQTVEMKEIRQASGSTEVVDETPLAQFMTTYVIGDDLYDDSFSIDSQSGEFLGECGVGISETIGVGESKKVTAFEVWLFDKNDIQTVTKVLMSEHAFNDPQISQRVISKGEPVILEPAKVILLETATLQLEVRVVDMTYGQSALPEDSYFDRITLDLALWPKAAN